eukprot:TRINITY_DN3612_c0_g1_i1.p1 TRINITY_DN3612_c0_g1~~TRINITY_DN3612_c0_g1_i1.p1  ORF type:complete len:399 (+),score=97.67 TRINITY_DN3612_c0_g1_i1:250-1446(+)
MVTVTLKTMRKAANESTQVEEKVELYDDEHFVKVRTMQKLGYQILITFDFDNDLKPGGGKGGELMGFTADKQFLIKEMKMSDHISLREYTKEYVERVTDASNPSLLPLFYLHFCRCSTGANFVVMNNFLPSLKGFPARDGVMDLYNNPVNNCVGWDRKYDIKGCKDDKTQEAGGRRVPEVHKRFFKFWMYCGCGISADRLDYVEGKNQAFDLSLHVTKEMKIKIDSMIRHDADFCANNNLMDHSLIIGTLSHPLSMLDKGRDVRTLFPESVAVPDQPYIYKHNGRVWALYLGVIDFLQDWNCSKKVAHCIKLCCAPKPMSTVEPSTYSDQFKALCHRFKDDAEEVHREVGEETHYLSDHDGDLSTFAFRFADWDEHEEAEVDRICEDHFRNGTYGESV